MAHAYVVVGGEEGVAKAKAFAERELGIDPQSGDIVLLKHGLFSVEDSRDVLAVASAAPTGERKAVIIALTRVFHEAQNALLKLFEEPPKGVTLVLVVPSEGILLSTLRSRLTALPETARVVQRPEISELARSFLVSDSATREKVVAKLVDRTKADKDDDKQAARSDAVGLAEDLLRVTDVAYRQAGGTSKEGELRTFADDLLHFLPLLHTRSAPIKLIFEHLLAVVPRDLTKTVI